MSPDPDLVASCHPSLAPPWSPPPRAALSPDDEDEGGWWEEEDEEDDEDDVEDEDGEQDEEPGWLVRASRAPAASPGGRVGRRPMAATTGPRLTDRHPGS